MRNRKSRREAVLRKMANMRAAKERKRLDNIVEPEPKFERWYPLEFGVRDKRTGETAWTDLRSARHASKAIGYILKFVKDSPYENIARAEKP